MAELIIGILALLYGLYTIYLRARKDSKAWGKLEKMKEVYGEKVNFLFENDMLTEDAVIVKECDEHFKDDERFSKYKTYKYGIIHVSVYWR